MTITVVTIRILAKGGCAIYESVEEAAKSCACKGIQGLHPHAQGAHQEMKKLFRSLKEKGTIISRLESQLSTSF